MKKYIVITLVASLFAFIAIAGTGEVFASDVWVLKETVEGNKILCEESDLCLSPSVAVGASSADLSWGWQEKKTNADWQLVVTCSGEYQLKSIWTAPPGTLSPGEKMNTNLESSASGNSTCEGYGGAPTQYTGFYMSTMIGEQLVRPPVGRMDVVSSAGGKDSRIVECTVPNGNPGDKLDLVFTTGTGGIGGSKHFVYEYSGVAVQAEEPVPELINEPMEDVKANEEPEKKESECKDSGARFSDFSGNVEVAPPTDLEDWDIAELGMMLCENSAVKTGIESNAIISFADMTTFVMKPESRIIVSSGIKQHSKIDLVAGNIWMNVKKMVKDGSMEVKMSQAVAGIKGTTFVLEETGNESRIKVIEGEVEFRSLADDAIAMVSASETVTASSAGLSPKATFDIGEESKSWNKTADASPTDEGDAGDGVPWMWLLAGLVALAAGAAFYLYRRNPTV